MPLFHKKNFSNVHDPLVFTFWPKTFQIEIIKNIFFSSVFIILYIAKTIYRLVLKELESLDESMLFGKLLLHKDSFIREPLLKGKAQCSRPGAN